MSLRVSNLNQCLVSSRLDWSDPRASCLGSAMLLPSCCLTRFVYLPSFIPDRLHILEPAQGTISAEQGCLACL
ncbi:hypothetical protein L596_001622 [Steinernema carpocapsae]|uniref:Uncharacterized protein n=1 Tax=Steinernema carpocapsae TaxID=34508 RepID=A0A4U8ULR8_STECR|nr:hypothetical protein L596_001622 [Steinernema carpocapsae]